MLLEAMLVTAALCVPSTPTDSAAAAARGSIRPRDGVAVQILNLGRDGSATFRALERTLNQSRVVVYVDVRDDPRKELGGSLQFISATRERLFVRAVVDTGTRQFGVSQQRLVVLASLLGHELQHAAEVASAPAIRNEREFEALFRRIGISQQRDGLETAEAQMVGKRVRRELQSGTRELEGCAAGITLVSSERRQ